ncbi:MAG: ornithine cyclodeaminase family protein [Planctomycetota bacterium]
MATPERGKEVLYLTQQDVRDVGLTTDELIELVRTALTEHGRKQVEMPAKIGIHPLQDTLMHAMPAWVPAVGACGIKWAECFPENYKFDLPQTSGLMVLNDPETGWPVCILDAIYVTAKRTPAVTALACEFLAREDTVEAGIAGAGVQGREHTLMLPRVLPNLETLKVFDRFPEVTEKLIDDLGPELPDVELVAADSVEQLVRGSLVVVSATAILAKPDPQVRDEWIEPGAFLAPIDFDSYWEWETFRRADKFIVDSQAEMEYFMTIGYLEHGLPPLHGEIGEVVAGVKPGRQSDDELIIDMNIGMAVEDVTVGIELYKRAQEKGLGRILPL